MKRVKGTGDLPKKDVQLFSLTTFCLCRYNMAVDAPHPQTTLIAWP